MITSTPAAGQVWLCENQISIVVTGIDHWVWTAYGIVDTYFGSKESLEHYDEQSDQSGQVDPLSKGQLHAHPLTLIWTPREYFLAVVAIRMNEALRAWRETNSVVEDIVKQYVYTLIHLLVEFIQRGKIFRFFLSFVKTMVVWKGSLH